MLADIKKYVQPVLGWKCPEHSLLVSSCHCPFHHIPGVDLITDLFKSHTHTVVLIIIDQFFKFIRLIPLPKFSTVYHAV